ncbi:MAG: hypothetical protein JO317_07260 [Verrucomicrobiae bacterium]|nr:hypothetical protein [Verrucomicrobiae bacterium]
MPDKTKDQVEKRIRASFEKAVGSMERGQLDAAIEILQQVLVSEPGFLEARKALRIAERKRAGGGGFMGRIVGSAAGSPALAKAAAIMSKNPEGAMEAIETAIASNPMNSGAHKMLADAAERGGYYLTATFAMSTARELSPNDIGILMNLARLYQLVKDGKRAQECYDRVLSMKPNDPDAIRGLKDASAVETMEKEGWDEADSYRNLIRDEKQAVTMEQQNRVMRDDKMVANLLHETYLKHQEQPDNIVFIKDMARLYTEINDFDNAIHWLEYANEKVAGADVSLEKLLNATKIKRIDFKIGKVKEQLGSEPANAALSKEIEDLQRERKKCIVEQQEMLVRRYPNDLEARFELGLLYYGDDRIDEAMKEFQLAANNPKNRVSAAHLMGMCLARKKMYDLAVPRLKAALGASEVMDATRKQILYDLGGLYEAMGKDKEAMEQYKQIYEVDIGYKDVSQKVEAHYKSQAAQN